MTSGGPLFHKPKSFLSARQMIYASVFTGILAMSIRTATIGIDNAGGLPYIAAAAIFYLVIVLLARQMSLCRKWARTATLVLFVLAMIIYPLVLNQEIKVSMLAGALFVMEAALAIYALVLLYNKECTEWFNSLPDTRDLP